MTATTNWDHSVDVLVVGSGAAAVLAAVTAYDRGGTTLLIEKSPLYGGSSAKSGGGLWIPNNHFMPAAGIQDSPEDAFTYLKGTARGAVPDNTGDALNLGSARRSISRTTPARNRPPARHAMGG